MRSSRMLMGTIFLNNAFTKSLLVLMTILAITFSIGMCGSAFAQEDNDQPTVSSLFARLKQTDQQKKSSLSSVKKIHDHPLYLMEYHGDYDSEKPLLSQLEKQSDIQWGCSLFFATGDKEKPLYGRNFDWQYNPALLLFTNPSDGYASVSMVDISYLGYARKDKKFDTVEGRQNLLMAPLIPFDGMNEHGLTVGMAAVPNARVPADEKKETVGGLQIIRIMLDKAKTVDEALELIKKHNVRFSGGPQIHYLIADAGGNSAVVEMKNEKINIIRGEKDFHSATNFHLTDNEGKGPKLCRRYAQIQTEMKNKAGKLDVDQAFKLLKNVSQVTTRWSVVYDLKGKTANIAMSRNYSKPLKYEVRDLEDEKKTSK